MVKRRRRRRKLEEDGVRKGDIYIYRKRKEMKIAKGQGGETRTIGGRWKRRRKTKKEKKGGGGGEEKE